MENKKVALVTGASSGIGRATARVLARDGFFVLVHFNSNEAGAGETLQQIRQAGGDGHIIGFDVSHSQAVDEKLEPLLQDIAAGQLSALINCAGVHKDGLAGMMTDEEFDVVIKANLYGPFYLMRWATRKMIRARHGSIINVASTAGQTGNAGQINYAASKAGLIAMTKSLAREVGKRGIRVNGVAPGFIETDMVNKVPYLEQLIQQIPMGRMGQPEEVAEVISFLCSDKASYINGHTISINGGLYPS